MTDIRVELGLSKFDVRACGLLRHQGELLVSTEVDGTQTLSGGAIKIGETSEEAVIRELKEETNLDVEVNRLVAIVENFFTYENKPYQQIIFVYELALKEPSQKIKCLEKVNVHWVKENEVNNLKPVILNEIVQIKDNQLKHFVNKD